jgi:hypothetical protein
MAFNPNGPQPPPPVLRGLPDLGSGPMSIRDLGETQGSQNFGDGARVSRLLGADPPTLATGVAGPRSSAPPEIPGIAGPPRPPGLGLQSPVRENPSSKETLYDARAKMQQRLKTIEDILALQKKLGIPGPKLAAEYFTDPVNHKDVQNVENAKIQAASEKEMKNSGLKGGDAAGIPGGVGANPPMPGPAVSPGARASIPPMGTMGGPQTEFGKLAAPRMA